MIIHAHAHFDLEEITAGDYVRLMQQSGLAKTLEKCPEYSDSAREDY